ncbi:MULTISPECIES: hypothetical protein [Nostoc]|uniref:Uncharacterized protein n=2 Tax=Nostoc TaxID=1177 RepID=A0ABR8IKF0_9NOSO|nr:MULTISPECIES: hypothetical protein [Nostoc]MBD2565638.1 hypothetical protein [Nostoc linckia FACHB-391]MBD2651417.1 hypothetical protein [Nostoc foliaceum FACHB-393]
MQPTITIPHGWKYPRFTLGQRTEQGIIIGIKYYLSDSLLAHEYESGWRYLVMPDINSIDEGNHLENEIKLLTPQELRAEIQTEIEKCLRQLELLKYELKAIPGGLADG